MDSLLLTLRAPLQSWGTHAAVGEMRPSADHPGRAAVVGLLAAALGIRRENPDALLKLHQALRLAVRCDRSGARLTDYHTAQTPSATGKRVFRTRRDELVTQLNRNETPNTVLSRREYLIAAAFTACLWLDGEAGHSLDEMRDALLHPRLPLYLGRKSCPLGFPLLPWRTQAEDILAAFQQYDEFRAETLAKDPQLAREQRRSGVVTPARIWSDQPLPDTLLKLTVRDVLVDSRRHFGQRLEYVGTAGEASHVHQQG